MTLTVIHRIAILFMTEYIITYVLSSAHWDKHLNADSFTDWMICFSSHN